MVGVLVEIEVAGERLVLGLLREAAAHGPLWWAVPVPVTVALIPSFPLLSIPLLLHGEDGLLGAKIGVLLQNLEEPLEIWLYWRCHLDLVRSRKRTKNHCPERGYPGLSTCEKGKLNEKRGQRKTSVEKCRHFEWPG